MVTSILERIIRPPEIIADSRNGKGQQGDELLRTQNTEGRDFSRYQRMRDSPKIP